MSVYLPDTVVALGNTSVKFGRFSGLRGRRRVEYLSSRKIGTPPFRSPLVGAESIASESDITRGISEMMGESKCKGGDCLVLVPDSMCVLKVLHLALKDRQEELDDEIARELSTLLPGDIVDWTFTRAIVGIHSKRNLAMVVAGLTENLDEIYRVISKTGLNPVCFDAMVPENLNLFHEYLELPLNRDRSIGILSVRSRGSVLSIFKNGYLRQVQTVAIGGVNFTTSLSTNLNISMADAEEVKKSGVIFLPKFTEEQKEVANFKALRPMVEEFCRVVFGSMENYFSTYDEFRVDEVLLLGAGAQMRNFEVTLSHYLNTSVISGTPVVKGAPDIDLSGMPDEALAEFCALLGTQKRVEGQP